MNRFDESLWKGVGALMEDCAGKAAGQRISSFFTSRIPTLFFKE
jgi:hypothetical protein